MITKNHKFNNRMNELSVIYSSVEDGNNFNLQRATNIIHMHT